MENRRTRVHQPLGLAWAACPAGRIDFARSILDDHPAAFGPTDADGRARFPRRQALAYLDQSLGELRDRADAGIVHLDDPSGVLEAWARAHESGGLGREHRRRRGHPSNRWFQAGTFPMRHSEGRIVVWQVFPLGIDDRKRPETELERSQAFLAQAQRLTQTGSLWWKPSAGEITWSEETYRLLEYPVTVTPTMELILSRCHPKDEPFVRERIATAIRDGVNLDFEHRLLMPDGTVKQVHVVMQRGGFESAAPELGAVEYIGAIQDVTERRRSEEALAKLHAELAHVARVTSLGALTASVAHEVNQPLSGIITNASTCLRMLASEPPNIEGARETARRTIRDGNRASEVIRRLRALFAKKSPTIEPVDLNVATREVLALSRSELRRSRAVLRSELAEDLPFAMGDRVQLQQVILNLLRNALDAMSGIDDRPREIVIRTAREEDERVRLSMQDAGSGFETDAVEELFGAFFTTKPDGMGIGLSVSRSIIESHRGRLWAVANDGPGVTFSFSIPRAPEASRL